MIQGASQADIGVLVISARKGEFETGFERGGQTREHAMLAKTSGINKLVIAVNKMDDPTVNWDKARYDEIVAKLTPFLRQSGYNPKTDVHFMPLSGFSGANIKDRETKLCDYYSGPSLLEFLDNYKTTDRKLNAPLMIPISEKYKVIDHFKAAYTRNYSDIDNDLNRIWVLLLSVRLKLVTSRRVNPFFLCPTR